MTSPLRRNELSHPSPEIAIPFADEMAIAAIDGRKTVTTRGEKYGEPGDLFSIKDPRDGRVHRFRFRRICKHSLDFVAHILYEEEGCSSSREFIELWERLHPDAGYDPNAVKWTHEFEKVGP